MFNSSHEISLFLFIDIKSFPKKIPSTPLTESKFLTNSLLESSFLIISNEPLFETVLPGKNFSEFGFGVSTETTAKNHLKLFKCLQSGSFTARSEEDQITTSYFVRARAAHFNFSNNPSFFSGSDATFSIPEFTGNPQTFITTIGLHDAAGTMVAVGRLSTPVLKNFSREFTAKVNLVH